TASSGSCTPASPGATSPSATAPGRPSTTASTAGARTALGPPSSPTCSNTSTVTAAWAATCGVPTPPSSALAGPPPGRKKKADQPRALGGPSAAAFAEPDDHALGRSQGGFGSKIHLLCDG